MYQTELDGQHHELGTSGFLYRSNKLMYDADTKSYWSTLQGEPVVGPLVGKDIQLKRRYLVTTTWGQWKKMHPETSVLSLDTGHQRDYREGAAYREYFATDRLMFGVPQLDTRLNNKDEVVALRNDKEQLAISAKFLSTRPVHRDRLGTTKLVVLTDTSGANRVYSVGERVFDSWNGNSEAVDSEGNVWKVSESSLSYQEKTLFRMPAHRVFWFGWYSQFPDTRLVR